MAKKGLAEIPIGPLIIFLIGIVAVIFILKNKHLLSFGPIATAGAAVGATVQGPNVYPVVGDIPRSGGFGTSVANDGTSFRDNVSFPCDKCARETTWFFTPGAPGEGDMDCTIKMGSHGGGSDNGSLIGFSADGQRWRCEGPHMTYHDLSGEGSVQLEASQRVGIKGISWNVSGNTQHHEIWLNADTRASEMEETVVPKVCQFVRYRTS